MSGAENPPPSGGPEGPDLHAIARDAAAAVQRQPTNINLLLLAANKFLRAGDNERAVGFARDAAAVDPTSFRALRALSGVLGATGARAEAIRVANLAVQLNPADAEVRLHLGGILAAERRWREAAEHLSVHVVSPAATPRGWRLLSSVLNQAGRVEPAIDAARHAVTADPNSIEYRLNLASLLTSSGRYDHALDELKIALAQAPDNVGVWRILSGVHAAMGQLTEALRTAEKAVELDGGDQACRMHLRWVAGLCEIPTGTPATGDPAKWAIKRRDLAIPLERRAPPRFSEDIATRWRVVYAIMLRDIRTRFGHTRLGYFWAIMEPISHLLTLGSVFFVLNHAPPPVGDNLFLYYITGLVPYLMFSHVTHHVMESAEANSAIMQLPIVRRTDMIAAAALRQFSTELCVGIIIFSVMGLLGEQALPTDLLTAFIAIILLWLLAVGVGTFNLILLDFFPSYNTFYNSLVRLLYFSSGIYYSPMSMPDWVRDWLVWNPVLQGIELFRSGFYLQYEPHWLDVNYLLTWIVASIGIGFALERTMRTRIVVAA